MKQKRNPHKVTDNISEFMSPLNITTPYSAVGFNEKLNNHPGVNLKYHPIS
jgi:hypothetical protein